MKGFLNKVQGKVSGKPAGNGADAKPTPHGHDAVAAAANAAKAEPTPRADISLPKSKERR